MTETMNATTPIERLKALAPRQHLSLGVMAANKPDDFAVVMAAAGCAFGAAEACSERDVNEPLFLRATTSPRRLQAAKSPTSWQDRRWLDFFGDAAAD